MLITTVFYSLSLQEVAAAEEEEAILKKKKIVTSNDVYSAEVH